jgi:hypothetical protein
MSKNDTHGGANDATTSLGTVKGHHDKPGAAVEEGGPAPSPIERPGQPKAAVSATENAGGVVGDDTSTATAGRQEKDHAATVGANKTQEGRGHRKHDERS